jgi:hypothetical protein
MTVIRVSALVTPMPMSALGIAKLAGRRPSEPPTPCSDPHALQGAQRFFAAAGSPNECGWTMLRDRWERSQLYRAVTSVSALIPLAVALLM